MRRQIKESRPPRWLVRENQVSKLVRLLSLASVTALSLAFLLAASPASAKELHFQGGDEPFGGGPIVGMTMTGPNYEKPKRVTGFTVTGFDWICGSGRGPADLETVPIHLDKNPKVAKKGIEITKNEDKDRWFEWKYESKGSDGTVFERYQLVGGQHRKHPKVWRGKVKIRHSEAGLQYGECTTNLDDDKGWIRWEARGIGEQE